MTRPKQRFMCIYSAIPCQYNFNGCSGSQYPTKIWNDFVQILGWKAPGFFIVGHVLCYHFSLWLAKEIVLGNFDEICGQKPRETPKLSYLFHACWYGLFHPIQCWNFSSNWWQDSSISTRKKQKWRIYCLNFINCWNNWYNRHTRKTTGDWKSKSAYQTIF